MRGEEIYKLLTDSRDYSWSENDQYSQLLGTLKSHATANKELEVFYALLKKAHDSGKRLNILEDLSILHEDFRMRDVFMV